MQRIDKTLRRFLSGLAALPLALAALPSEASLRVFACEPEWGALARELGGADVEVSVATTALQDPHRIQARPSLIARVRNADLVVCTGAELEAGWLPLLLQQSGNAGVQAGRPGHFLAADFVRLRDVPARVDRSEGDVHAAGNPHIQTDPRNIRQVAGALGERMQQLDAPRAAAYAARLADFDRRWREALERWNRLGAPLRGTPVVSQHKAFVYLHDWLGLEEVAVLEPKPGVEPSVSHLQGVVAALGGRPARIVLHAAYQNPRPSKWLEANHGIAAVELPFTVGGSEEAKDLFGLFDVTLARLLAAVSKR